MKISVIIPAYNEQKMIQRSVRAIHSAAEAFQSRNWAYEVVVCDNNSTDLTAEYARAEGAQVVFEPINQIARARNKGASAARGEWLIFVDADSFPSKELFADVSAHIARGDIAGGGVVVQLDQARRAFHILVRVWNRISRWNRWMAGSFIFCERKVFEEMGGFSHELFAGEEIEFSRRFHRVAKARKRRVVILHKHPLLTSARKAYLYSGREYLKFIVRTVLRAGRPLRRREDCPIWYDGRR